MNVIYSLGGGHTCTHTYTDIPKYFADKSYFKKPGMCQQTWIKNGIITPLLNTQTQMVQLHVYALEKLLCCVFSSSGCG